MMKALIPVCVAVLISGVVFSRGETLGNSQIDYQSFLTIAQEVAPYREARRVSTAQFLAMAREPDTIILDTRSRANYLAKHLAGAEHLNFSEITEGGLTSITPNKDTRILIYCNNNFSNNSPQFLTKIPEAALNIPTYITLYAYGYRNLYELADVLDENDTVLPFEGKLVEEQN